MAIPNDITLARAKAHLSQLAATESSPFESDIIEVIVGPAEKRYHVHKDKICAVSPFFKRCLESNMVESESRTVKLPADDPEAFAFILEWTYGQQIESPKDEKVADVRRLIKTYALADKLCMEILGNALVNEVMDWHRNNVGRPDLLLEAPESPLRDFLVDQFAWDVGQPTIWKPNGLTDTIEKFFRSGGPEVVSVMRAYGKFVVEKDLVDPCEGPKCKYHKHVDTEKCKEGSPTK